MAEAPNKQSFWQTLPGIITALAALITALVGAVVGLNQAGIFKNVEQGTRKTPSSEVEPKHTPTTPPAQPESKLSDEVSTRGWIFQVRNLYEANEYNERLYQEERLVRPVAADDVLLVIEARLKNSLQKVQEVWLSERAPENTSLIDSENHSYQPLDYDARLSEQKTFSESASVGPGANADFALCLAYRAELHLSY